MLSLVFFFDTSGDGWLFNSLAVVESLTWFLVHVIVNLAFVSQMSKRSFFLCRVSSFLVVSPQLHPSEQTHCKTSQLVAPMILVSGRTPFLLMPNICGNPWGPSHFPGLWAEGVSWPCAGRFICSDHALSAGFSSRDEGFGLGIPSPAVTAQTTWSRDGWAETTLLVITQFLLPCSALMWQRAGLRYFQLSTNASSIHTVYISTNPW